MSDPLEKIIEETWTERAKRTGRDERFVYADFAVGFRAGTERAAKIAEDEKVSANETGQESDEAYNRACDDIARAIRGDE